MAWCPICKNEYDDAVNICGDCNCLLLKGNPSDFTELLVDADEEIVLNAFNSLVDNDFESAQYYCDSKDVYHLMIANADYDDAKIFLLSSDKEELVNAEDLYSNEQTLSVDAVTTKKAAKPYVKLSEKVSDLKSSAYSLLIIGVLGAIFLVLEYFDVFNFNFSASAHIIFYVVMGIMFGAFIILGIASFVSMNKLKPIALKHEQLTKDVLEYAETDFNKENAEKAVELVARENPQAEVDDLFYYYQRARLIRTFITDKFEIDDESFLDYLVEEIYSKYFGEDDYDFDNAEIIEDETEINSDEN